MKRSIIFECAANEYVLKEDEKIVFSIKKDELKFDSLSFYNNIYAPGGSSLDIELEKKIPAELSGEDKRMAEHVFKCVHEIITNITTEMCDSKGNYKPNK